MQTLMCHIVWMPRYAGEDEVFPAGFDYVREEGYGHELFNYKPFGDFCYGYVEARAGTLNIDRLGADADDTFLEDVTIIWTASSPRGGRLIVGWYKRARVYRNLQRGTVRGREIQGRKIGYYAKARTEDCFLIPIEQRDFFVPHSGRGLPGQSSVFYPQNSDIPEMRTWLDQATTYVSAWTGNPVAGRIDATGAGWPSPPDAAHNAAVEAAAIAFVRRHLGNERQDRQKHNCGWDLEFTRAGRNLCVEVKGLSGSAVGVELTPKEYAAMKRAMTNSFSEGEYRLAVVCNALANPELFLFAHSKGVEWICELTHKIICVAERIGARLTDRD
jgi:Domain of unknown function (DUF3883)